MGDAETGPEQARSRSSPAWSALGFGLAALASSWHALSAPFGLLVGLASAVLAVRALRAGRPRRSAVVALVLAAGAVAASSVALARGAGQRRAEGSAAVLPGAPAGPAGGALEGAASESRAARERARGELDALERSEPPAPSR